MRDVKKFVQIHKASKCQRQVSNSGPSKSTVFILLYWSTDELFSFCFIHGMMVEICEYFRMANILVF